MWVEPILAWWWSRGLNVLGTGDIVGKNFWNEHSGLLKEVGAFTEEVEKIKPEFVQSFHLI